MITAKTLPRRLATIAIAGIVAVTAGCARTPYYADPFSDGAAVTRPSSTVSNPFAAKGSGPVPWVDRRRVVGVERGYDSQASRLQRRERAIGSRITTIDRQLDIIDICRRQRLLLEPHRRNRSGPREVLLQRESRNLQFEQRSVSRELDRLEFERRIGRSTPDPFANNRRFPSPSILKR